MTRSQMRDRMSVRRVLHAALGASILGGALACVSAGDVTVDVSAFQSDVSTVEVISANVGGKNVFVPSTIVVTAGRPITLSLFNTTDTPHGFSIAGLGVQEVIPSRQETPVALPALEAGRVYRIHCQLHPPHRSATLVVLPGD